MATIGFGPGPVAATQSTYGWGQSGEGGCVGRVHHDRAAGWNMVIIVKIRLSQGFLWDGENVLELDSSDGHTTL